MMRVISIALCLAGAALASSEAERNCDNDCFFSNFVGGPCSNDPACVCNQKAMREAYFCCIAKTCSVDDFLNPGYGVIARFTQQCIEFNKPIGAFDAEATCGVKVAYPVTTTTSASTVVTTTAAVTPTGPPGSSGSSGSTSSGSPSGTPSTTSAAGPPSGTSPPAGASTTSTARSGANQQGSVFGLAAALAAGLGILI